MFTDKYYASIYFPQTGHVLIQQLDLIVLVEFVVTQITLSTYFLRISSILGLIRILIHCIVFDTIEFGGIYERTCF